MDEISRFISEGVCNVICAATPCQTKRLFYYTKDSTLTDYTGNVMDFFLNEKIRGKILTDGDSTFIYYFDAVVWIVYKICIINGSFADVRTHFLKGEEIMWCHNELLKKLESDEMDISDTVKLTRMAPQENDQKAKADAGKPRVSLVPSQIVYDIAKIREYGNKKYPEGGKDNWKRVEVERYRDAAYRHLLAYIDDPHGVDDESRLPHLWHLACNVAFLCELEKDNFGEKVSEEDISYMD